MIIFIVYKDHDQPKCALKSAPYFHLIYTKKSANLALNMVLTWCFGAEFAH